MPGEAWERYTEIDLISELASCQVVHVRGRDGVCSSEAEYTHRYICVCVYPCSLNVSFLKMLNPCVGYKQKKEVMS